MYANERKVWVGVIGRMLLAWMLLFAQSAWAGQGPKVPDPASTGLKSSNQKAGEKQSSSAAIAKSQAKQPESEPAAEAVEEKNSSGDGSHEGIKVHGHWTIEVRNPDGTVVAHREFENSLTGAGGYPLSTSLARSNSVGLWQVNLNNACPGSVESSDCIIEENASPITGPGIFKTLVISAPTNASGINVFQLAGTAVAGGTAQIGAVQTFVNVCPPPIAAGSCAPSTAGGFITSGYLFTQAILNNPVNVVAGQTIAVTVVISFS